MRIAALALLAFFLAAVPAAARPTAIVSIGRQLHLGRGRPLARATAPNRSGRRSGTDRAAYGCGALGCEYDPARVYGASEADDCHRSDVAPIESAPIAVDEKVNLACSGAKARDLWPAAEGGTLALRRAAGGRPARGGGAARRRADGRGHGGRERCRLRRTGGRMRARLGAQPGGRTEHLPPRRRGADPRRAAGGDARRHRGAARGAEDDAGGGLRALRLPAGGDGLRLAVSRGPLVPLSRGRLDPADRRRLPGLERRRRLGGGPGDRRPRPGRSRAAAAATRRRVPRPRRRLRRPPALRPPRPAGRRRRPVTADGRVVPPPLLHPGLDPRIAPSQRLRPAA